VIDALAVNYFPAQPFSGSKVAGVGRQSQKSDRQKRAMGRFRRTRLSLQCPHFFDRAGDEGRVPKSSLARRCIADHPMALTLDVDVVRPTSHGP